MPGLRAWSTRAVRRPYAASRLRATIQIVRCPWRSSSSWYTRSTFHSSAWRSSNPAARPPNARPRSARRNASSTVDGHGWRSPASHPRTSSAAPIASLGVNAPKAPPPPLSPSSSSSSLPPSLLPPSTLLRSLPPSLPPLLLLSSSLMSSPPSPSASSAPSWQTQHRRPRRRRARHRRPRRRHPHHRRRRLQQSWHHRHTAACQKRCVRPAAQTSSAPSSLSSCAPKRLASASSRSALISSRLQVLLGQPGRPLWQCSVAKTSPCTLGVSADELKGPPRHASTTEVDVDNVRVPRARRLLKRVCIHGNRSCNAWIRRPGFKTELHRRLAQCLQPHRRVFETSGVTEVTWAALQRRPRRHKEAGTGWHRSVFNLQKRSASCESAPGSLYAVKASGPRRSIASTRSRAARTQRRKGNPRRGRAPAALCSNNLRCRVRCQVGVRVGVRRGACVVREERIGNQHHNWPRRHGVDEDPVHRPSHGAVDTVVQHARVDECADARNDDAAARASGPPAVAPQGAAPARRSASCAATASAERKRASAPDAGACVFLSCCSASTNALNVVRVGLTTRARCSAQPVRLPKQTQRSSARCAVGPPRTHTKTRSSVGTSAALRSAARASSSASAAACLANVIAACTTVAFKSSRRSRTPCSTTAAATISANATSAAAAVGVASSRIPASTRASPPTCLPLVVASCNIKSAGRVGLRCHAGKRGAHNPRQHAVQRAKSQPAAGLAKQSRGNALQLRRLQLPRNGRTVELDCVERRARRAAHQRVRAFGRPRQPVQLGRVPPRDCRATTTAAARR